MKKELWNHHLNNEFCQRKNYPSERNGTSEITVSGMQKTVEGHLENSIYGEVFVKESRERDDEKF